VTLISRAAGLLLIVALLTAVVGAGCGGGGGDTSKASTSSTALTIPTLDKAKFLKLANAACREARAGLGQRVASYERITAKEKPGSYVDMVHFVFLPTIEGEILGIEHTGIPKGEKERLRVLLAADRTAVDAVAVMEKVPSIAVAERHFVKSGRMLRAYGLSACANGNRR
jgi:hypothetical protein